MKKYVKKYFLFALITTGFMSATLAMAGVSNVKNLGIWHESRSDDPTPCASRSLAVPPSTPANGREFFETGRRVARRKQH